MKYFCDKEMSVMSHRISPFIFVFFYTIFKITANEYSYPDYTDVVLTSTGPVRGLIMETTPNDQKYAAFDGIFYGQPPVGYLRFKVLFSSIYLIKQ